MNKHWFKNWGWVYRPISVVGWLLSLATLLFIIWIFIVIDRNSHSVSDTLFEVFIWAWVAVATLNWIASKTSSK